MDTQSSRGLDAIKAREAYWLSCARRAAFEIRESEMDYKRHFIDLDTYREDLFYLQGRKYEAVNLWQCYMRIRREMTNARTQ